MARATIIMAAHDAARTIGAAIDSVIAQTDPDWRLLVIDDGSSDGTAGIVDAIADPRVTRIAETGRGAAAARNRGLDEAGTLAADGAVAFLDSDDLWRPHFLERMHAALAADSAIGLVWCDMECFEGATGTYRGERPPVVGEATETLPAIFSSITFLGSAVLARATPFTAGLRYPERFRTMEDVHVWGAIAAESAIAHVDETLVDYRVRIDSLSNAPGSMLKNLCDNVRSYRAFYRRHRIYIPRFRYLERMWRAHHFAAEDRIAAGHTGWIASIRALWYRPFHAPTWKNLVVGARAKWGRGSRAAETVREPGVPSGGRG